MTVAGLNFNLLSERGEGYPSTLRHCDSAVRCIRRGHQGVHATVAAADWCATTE
jgi:hypothetical protein